MYRQKYLILSLALLVLPGCWKSKKNKGTPVEFTEAGQVESRTSVFDEHADAFVLEEADNPFSPDGSVRLVEDSSLWQKGKQDFEEIYFEFGQSRIEPEQKAALKRNVERIREAVARGETVVIAGHACNSAGSEQHNMHLSHQRAQQVMDFLVKQGIPANKLKVVGYGYNMCKVQGGTREQQAPNRRVESYVIFKAS